MILEGAERRKALYDYLSRQNQPVSGTELSREFGVSRQVIVQDIALLRAENKNILSTNKGYMLYHRQPEEPAGFTTVITVKHSSSETLEEMYSIVDYGGSMLDVFVDHDLYGTIRVDLVIKTKKDAEDFCEKLSTSISKPLKELTEGCHYHTIKAPSEKAMKMILSELSEKGFLLS